MKQFYLVLLSLFLVVGFLNLATSSFAQSKGACRNNPYPPPQTGENDNFSYQWLADCQSDQSKSCRINDDCPKNTTDPERVNPNTSNWCYPFDEGNRCLVLASKEKKSNNTEKRLTKVNLLESRLKKYSSSQDADVKKYRDLAGSLIKQTQQDAKDCISKIDSKDPLREECKDRVKQEYKKVEISYRLTKYAAIVSGIPSICVEADLGVRPSLEAKGITAIQEKDKNNPKETGKSAKSRLFLCNGADGKVKWRILYNNKLLRVTDDDIKALNLSDNLNNLPNKTQVNEAKKRLGV